MFLEDPPKQEQDGEFWSNVRKQVEQVLIGKNIKEIPVMGFSDYCGECKDTIKPSIPG